MAAHLKKSTAYLCVAAHWLGNTALRVTTSWLFSRLLTRSKKRNHVFLAFLMYYSCYFEIAQWPVFRVWQPWVVCFFVCQTQEVHDRYYRAQKCHVEGKKSLKTSNIINLTQRISMKIVFSIFIKMFQER